MENLNRLKRLIERIFDACENWTNDERFFGEFTYYWCPATLKVGISDIFRLCSCWERWRLTCILPFELFTFCYLYGNAHILNYILFLSKNLTKFLASKLNKNSKILFDWFKTNDYFLHVYQKMVQLRGDLNS